MRASWKRLVIVVVYVFFLWILFHLFLFYWKYRKPMTSTVDMPVAILRTPRYNYQYRYSTKVPEASQPLIWHDQLHFTDKTWKRWSEGMKAGRSEHASGRFVGFLNQFARLGPVLLDGNKASGMRGGEEIKSVLNQAEHKEFLNFNRGFFQLPCDMAPNYAFNLGHKNHLNKYMNSLTCAKQFDSVPAFKFGQNKTLFVVTRYEYVNIYHSMTDFYNAFLNMAFLGLQPDNVVILLADGHPKGGLDSVWSTLFSSYRRVGELRDGMYLADDMVWVQLSYLSPLIQHKLPDIPATEEFRHFFLTRYKVKNSDRLLNCSKLSVTFIWRRDYLAHPRNPSGHVFRKIKNEKELVAEVRHEIPMADVRGAQIDLLPMREQLQLIVDSDILIGMHGAGLTHALFLPKHAGLIEFYPTYWSEGNVHFKKIAHWRHLHYQRWVNHNPRLEFANHFTKIPPGVVSSMVRQILHSMRCTRHER